MWEHIVFFYVSTLKTFVYKGFNVFCCYIDNGVYIYINIYPKSKVVKKCGGLKNLKFWYKIIFEVKIKKTVYCVTYCISERHSLIKRVSFCFKLKCNQGGDFKNISLSCQADPKEIFLKYYLDGMEMYILEQRSCTP